MLLLVLRAELDQKGGTPATPRHAIRSTRRVMAGVDMPAVKGDRRDRRTAATGRARAAGGAVLPPRNRS